jgi:hypothetical protein
VRSAVAPVPGDPVVATAHDDGSLTLWGGDDLRRLATCRPPFAGAAVAGLAATAVDGGTVDGDVGGVVVVATSRHGQVAGWSASRETAAEPWDVTADDVAALAGGRLLLVGPDALTIADAGGAVRGTIPLPERPTTVAAGVAAHGSVVWTADGAGRVRRRLLDEAGALTEVSDVAVLPGLRLLQCGHGGAAVAVHGTGTTVLPAAGDHLRARAIELPGPARAAVTTAGGELLGGGSGSDSWLVVASAERLEPLRWREELTAIRITASASRVVLVGRRSLATLQVSGEGSP